MNTPSDTTPSSVERRPASEVGHATFATTRWTEVFTARDPAAPDSNDALERLCRAYWKPLYVWIRRQGHSVEDAQDLTQAFFHRLLEKDWLRSVARERGRFRSFLLVALKRFLADEWDRARALKRGGGQPPVSFETALAEETLVAASAGRESPDQLYERHWAMTLIDRALASLRDEFQTTGRADEFAALKEFLVAGRGEISYRDVAERLQLSEGAARVAVHRLRKRFRELFRAAVAQTVEGEDEVEDEMRFLMAALSR